jgi:hypothetical protein
MAPETWVPRGGCGQSPPWSALASALLTFWAFFPRHFGPWSLPFLACESDVEPQMIVTHSSFLCFEIESWVFAWWPRTPFLHPGWKYLHRSGRECMSVPMS